MSLTKQGYTKRLIDDEIATALGFFWRYKYRGAQILRQDVDGFESCKFLRATHEIRRPQLRLPTCFG